VVRRSARDLREQPLGCVATVASLYYLATSVVVAMATKEKTHRSMVFTVHNYDDSRVAAIMAAPVKRISCGYETCPTTGTPHIQGAVVWTVPVSYKTAQTRLGGNCFTEKMQGSWASNVKYTQKDGNVLRYEDTAEQGHRTDLDGPVELVRAGKRMREVAEAHPRQFVKFHKGLYALASILRTPRDWVPTVTVLYGATGTCKSRKARELLSEPRYVWGPQQGQWFDGYEGDENVLFEEFRGQLPFGMLLMLLDRYDCKVQVKGGMTEFRGRNIVITSPQPPDEWFPCLHGSDRIDQLTRRITSVVCMDPR